MTHPIDSGGPRFPFRRLDSPAQFGLGLIHATEFKYAVTTHRDTLFLAPLEYFLGREPCVYEVVYRLLDFTDRLHWPDPP